MGEAITDPRTNLRRPAWLIDALAIIAMLIVVAAIYWPPALDAGHVQCAADFHSLHERRMEFARDALFSANAHLPAWYPRELLGTPFWSNVQSFPFIPNRLLVLLTLDPSGPHTYAIAVILAAWLAATFTYLFSRRIGLGPIAAAAGGGTFACCGFFAARIAAGHLPLLEAFYALPLMLWCVESYAQASERGDERARRWRFLALALSTTIILLAGHPQLPVYALAAAALYALWRARPMRRAISIGMAMALGAGCAACSLIPMAMLVGRSTRILPLAAASNDVPFPYHRLLAFFTPWAHGAPSLLPISATHPLRDAADTAIFWDTVCYVGWLPWIAVAVLLAIGSRAMKSAPIERRRAITFLIAIGVGGTLLALPLTRALTSAIPGTFLRSPARLMYFTEFALCLALAAGVQLIVRSNWPRVIAMSIVAIALVLHALDLGRHDRAFICTQPILSAADAETLAAPMRQLQQAAPGARVAVDYYLLFPANRSIDDVGFFDSIMLARPYQFLIDLARQKAELNAQDMIGGVLNPRALRAAGVALVETVENRTNLAPIGAASFVKMYTNPSPSPRAAFFETSSVRFASRDVIRQSLRDPEFHVIVTLLLPDEARSAAPSFIRADDARGIEAPPAPLEYRRPDGDHIECTVSALSPGYVRILESWDPGWSATVDGAPARVVPAFDALLAVAVPSGRHDVRFAYHTPGATAGIVVSLVSAAALLLVTFRFGKRAGSASSERV